VTGIPTAIAKTLLEELRGVKEINRRAQHVVDILDPAALCRGNTTADMR
jgi:hypothetical protein